MRRPATLLLLALALGGTAPALDVGGRPLPIPPIPDRITPAVREIGRDKIDEMRERSRLAREALNGARDAVGRPLEVERDIAELIERMPDGSRAIRGEILATAPTDAAERLWEAEGLDIVRRDQLDPLGIELVVLRASDGTSSRSLLSRLRQLDPAGSYDLNHLYDPSGSATLAAGALVPSASDCDDCRIGAVDSGADASHTELSRARIEQRGFASREALPSLHGTAIAALLVGREGAARGARLYLADIYGGEAEGGSAESIARALAWLAEEETPVVTMSLAGPPNAVLEQAVTAMIARGHVIVAAVGNSGPAAPAAYPAAYPGVIGVTAIDASGQVAIDAQRGAQVTFAAYGVDLGVPRFGGGETTMTGTSFAAPRVAARAAMLTPGIAPGAAEQVLATLRSLAVDLGAPGRDDIFGYGALEMLQVTAAAP